ncbi:hypothetical protein STCU_10217 [Strigomonas culicis]|uniref:Uncharacterized protein n=1 Tax=Strigomonas culicis TaxID=28005 RepID=S9V599_9TRYP|nr:hypothetical protein STCU_10217 [Strigomonas culicis]|eukprot:EPY18050.1 hypothetical protein STCU_10217 [Strigomonas culicis]
MASIVTILKHTDAEAARDSDNAAGDQPPSNDNGRKERKKRNWDMSYNKANESISPARTTARLRRRRASRRRPASSRPRCRVGRIKGPAANARSSGRSTSPCCRRRKRRSTAPATPSGARRTTRRR